MTHFISGKLGATPDVADAAPVFTLGVSSEGADGNTYKYFTAGEDIDAFSVCMVDEAGQLLAVDTTLAGAVPSQVVVPQLDLAVGESGWAVCSGLQFKVLAAIATDKDVKLYTSGIKGVVDDAAGPVFQGLRLNEDNATGVVSAISASAAAGITMNAQDD